MKPAFRRLAVLGLGLLGGSVAAAVRERGIAETVVGAARRPEPLERALSRGIVDEIGTVTEAVRGADLVVLATPVGSMEAVLREVHDALAPGVLVTDVGSVKAELAVGVPPLLPAGAIFVGSHPMAGGHELGVDQARADLFEDSCCVVTPGPGTPLEAIERVEEFWRALGARIARRDPEDHDDQAAWVSHVPHILAFAYAHALAAAPEGTAELVGSGFRDFTRIARSDSELWSDILLRNRSALAKPLRVFREALGQLEAAILADDRASGEGLLETAVQRLDALAPIPGDGQTLAAE